MLSTIDCHVDRDRAADSATPLILTWLVSEATTSVTTAKAEKRPSSSSVYTPAALISHSTFTQTAADMSSHFRLKFLQQLLEALAQEQLPCDFDTLACVVQGVPRIFRRTFVLDVVESVLSYSVNASGALPVL